MTDERKAGGRRYFDEAGGRLVFVGSAATAEFWDAQWTEMRDPVRYRRLPRRSLVGDVTRRYLPPGALVLEGGCGLAHKSWILRQLGYRTLALDYAAETVEWLKQQVPEVNPVQGDVRALPVADASLDGYWSFGVIEHFYDGYDAIRDEMRRVIRPGGFLFLTFPHMSRARWALARAGRYLPWRPDPELLRGFYQFALDEQRVAADFEQHGFRLRALERNLGITGLEHELPAAGRALRLVERRLGRAGSAVAAGAERLLRPVSSHTALLVLERLP